MSVGYALVCVCVSFLYVPLTSTSHGHNDEQRPSNRSSVRGGARGKGVQPGRGAWSGCGRCIAGGGVAMTASTCVSVSQPHDADALLGSRKL